MRVSVEASPVDAKVVCNYRRIIATEVLDGKAFDLHGDPEANSAKLATMWTAELEVSKNTGTCHPKVFNCNRQLAKRSVLAKSTDSRPKSSSTPAVYLVGRMDAYPNSQVRDCPLGC